MTSSDLRIKLGYRAVTLELTDVIVSVVDVPQFHVQKAVSLQAEIPPRNVIPTVNG